MSDFKDCENLVHVLEIDEEEIKLEELQSVFSNYETQSTTNQESEYDDSSEVEDIIDEK